jgi:hypothetical protein
MTELEVAAQEYMNQNKPLFNSITPVNPTLIIFLADLIGFNQLADPIIDPRTNKEIPLTKGVFVILDQDLNIKYCYEDRACPNPFQAGSINSDKSGANIPILTANMIPVKWDGANWVKASNSNRIGPNQWYDYDQYMWANAVTVAELGSGTGSDGITRRNRGAYLSAIAGTPISIDDILTFFVWIPRYKYAISVGTGPREINIDFEIGSSTTGTGDGEGTSYLTHPAFTFGDVELRGLWIAKFAASPPPGSNCFNERSIGNCNLTNIFPLFIPNRPKWTNVSLSNMFVASRNIQLSNDNPYGFPQTGIDIHLTKNREWGAVAYLSHSKYGKFDNPEYTGNNKEIYKHNSWAIYTGRSGGTPGGLGIGTPTLDYSIDGYYTYDGKCSMIHPNLPPPCNSGSVDQTLTNKNLAFGASTTGNIYGAYDMVGGSWEYAMGNLNNSISNSGFISMPELKYYDLYLTTNGIKGDATNADGTNGWYGDRRDSLHSSFPWSLRSCDYDEQGYCGIFAYSSSQGAPHGVTSFRVVLAIY